jgi:6,7-dimethyl-8-ribityllumazine synthase
MAKSVFISISNYYPEISEMLLRGATATLDAAGIKNDLLSVPGAFEIPSAIAMAAHSGRYSAYIALGCVIRGETSHYDIVAQESARGLQWLATRQLLAIGNGILTCETMNQAIERADPARANKGGLAAACALSMIEAREIFGLEAASV